jgi:hypothetical protein
MFDNRKDEETDRKSYRKYKQHSNAKYEVTITRNQGKMHQMKPKVHRLKKSCTYNDGVRKEGSVRSTTLFWFTWKLNSGGFTAE